MDHKLNLLIEELTVLWLLWMKNHNFSNMKKNLISKRRTAGMECERLQRRRQEIIQEINNIFNTIL
jgi:hypothetical protein